MTTPRKKVLVATDFSPGSDDALAQAITLANQMNASLEILHVVELGTQPFPFGLLDSKDGGDFFSYIERQLETRAEGARCQGIPCTIKLFEGNFVAEIVTRARDL